MIDGKSSIPESLRDGLFELQRGLISSSQQKLYIEKNKDGKHLLRVVRKKLLSLSDNKHIQNRPEDIYKSLKFDDRGDVQLISYGKPNFKRDKTKPHITRTLDKAWFDFGFIASKGLTGLWEVVAYRSELRVPEDRPNTFIRLDLNMPDHTNEDRGYRSHVHINSDDDGIRLPSPVYPVLLLIDLMTFGLHPSGRERDKKS